MTVEPNWHWDNDRQRWVCMNYPAGPSYSWSLHKDEWVYTNPDMMAAIDASVQNMLTFPDSDAIIDKLRQTGDNNDV